MEYANTRRAIFIERPNRFVAKVELDGGEALCHVKNTGRCRELLIPGAEVILSHCPSEARKTEYDLIAVYKGNKLINMDSSAPNAIAGQWLRSEGAGFAAEDIKPEFTFGDSRFDFYFRHDGIPCLMEVKGVTLENGGVVRFPDAPTLRGVKHLRGLCRAAAQGFDCYVLFVVQMRGVKYFEPNYAAHPEFAEALKEASRAGVQLLAIDCSVEENSISPRARVDIRLE